MTHLEPPEYYQLSDSANFAEDVGKINGKYGSIGKAPAWRATMRASKFVLTPPFSNMQRGRMWESAGDEPVTLSGEVFGVVDTRYPSHLYRDRPPAPRRSLVLSKIALGSTIVRSDTRAVREGTLAQGSQNHDLIPVTLHVPLEDIMDGSLVFHDLHVPLYDQQEEAAPPTS